VKDRKDTGTITTGIENRFGAGVKALPALRKYWPTARDYLAGWTIEDGDSTGAIVAGE
jgi:hypothetical protein